MLLEDFPGPANQTRCFLHILSITAKSIIKQFDLPKAKNGEVVDEATQLADGLDVEDQEGYGDRENEAEEEGDEEDRPLDRWVELRAGLTEERRDEIEVGIQPVRSTLTKVVMLRISATTLLTNLEQ